MHEAWLEASFAKITRGYWCQRRGHAFLLTGAHQDNMALLLNKVESFFLCHHPREGGACGQCRSCHLFLHETHPDYHVYGKEDAAISVDEIREIHDLLQRTTHQAGTRVITLYGADALSKYAANALLKNLEEPPAGNLFFLVAAKFSQVLPTLRSRCLPIHIPLQYAAKNSENSDHALLKEALFWGNSSLFYQEEVTKKLNAQTKETLYLFYYWVAEYCHYGLLTGTEYLWTVDEKARMDTLRDTLSVEKALRFLDVLNDGIKSLSITGINKGLLWGSLVHQWATLRIKG